jgi:hypothetical protein
MTTAGSMASSLPSSTRGLEADLATGEDLAQGLTTYQASGVKRVDGRTARWRGAVRDQPVKRRGQASAADLISVAGHQPKAAPNTYGGSMFSRSSARRTVAPVSTTS